MNISEDRLNDKQKKFLANVKLTIEKIREIEKSTQWKFFLRSDVKECYFTVHDDSLCALFVYLDKQVTIKFYVRSDKGGSPSKALAQNICKAKLGNNWSPKGVSASGFDLTNRNNETTGYVGTWKFDFGKERFADNFEKVKNVAIEINNGLREIYEELPKSLSRSKTSSDEPNKISCEVLQRVVVGMDGESITAQRNRIVFGAPGTGKSYKINTVACRHKDDADNFVSGIFENKEGTDCRYERVTFYPTYSYAQFVGTYKPVMRPAEGGEEIAYEFVPGPFLRVLVNALKESVTDGKKNGWCLIIEEINRANAAAVFGDVFQLLDRGANGVSEYSVAASEDIKGYLKKELGGQQEALQFLNVGNDGENDDDWKSCSLRIPDNMYIWATMNSADQGVFPMDTAFKRRWEFEYVGINDGEGKASEWTIGEANSNPDPKWNWNANRKLINRLLTLCGVNEDKLMGPFFVTATGGAVSKEQFKSKVLMYLWEDAARMCRSKLFPKVKTYSELVELWNDNGPKIFEEVMKNDSLGNHAQTEWLALHPSKNGGDGE